MIPSEQYSDALMHTFSYQHDAVAPAEPVEFRVSNFVQEISHLHLILSIPVAQRASMSNGSRLYNYYLYVSIAECQGRLYFIYS